MGVERKAGLPQYFVVVLERVVDQALRGSTRHGCEAVRRTLAGDRREPAVGKRELRSHVVVIVEERLIVVPHGALTHEIIGRIAAASLPISGRAGFGIVLGDVNKAVHLDGTGRGGEEVVGVHIAIAAEPVRSHVVDTGSGELEQREGS